MAVIVVGSKMTGYRGKYETYGTPVSFSEAWADASYLAGLIFVVTFFVVAIWLLARSPEPTRSGRRPS
jgi:hypothetical protein